MEPLSPIRRRTLLHSVRRCFFTSASGLSRSPAHIQAKASLPLRNAWPSCSLRFVQNLLLLMVSSFVSRLSLDPSPCLIRLPDSKDATGSENLASKDINSTGFVRLPCCGYLCRANPDKFVLGYRARRRRRRFHHRYELNGQPRSAVLPHSGRRTCG